MGINYGYIRVSASDQNESRQLYAMEKNGIKQKNIFVDKQSGKNFERKQYKALLRKLKEGDVSFERIQIQVKVKRLKMIGTEI